MSLSQLFSPDVFVASAIFPYACLTVCIEVPVFFLCGYRRTAELLCFAIINIATNLLLNEFLLSESVLEYYKTAVFLGELIVIPLEYALFSCLFPQQRTRKLFVSLVWTNGISFLAGIVLFWP